MRVSQKQISFLEILLYYPANADTIRQMSTLRPETAGGLKTSAAVLSGIDTSDQLMADCDTVCDISSGLDHLEAKLDATPDISEALARGYFAPDEDDRLRQALLAYRNYRLAAYEIIFRHRDAAVEPNLNGHLKGFLLAFTAALVLSEKSLRIIGVAEHQPMLRAKINEPDSKFEFPSGFFEEVVLGYSSIKNFRILVRADRNWRALRRSSVVRSLDADSRWRRLTDLIRLKRGVVRRRLASMVARRVQHGWRSFLKTALKPAKATQSKVQALVGRGLAGAYVVPNPVHVLTTEVLELLRPRLQPGDVLLCRAEGKLTAALMPGFWSHAAIYLGSIAGLELLGVQDHVHAAKRWRDFPAQISPLGWVIEGVAPRVRISGLETCLQADHVLVLRPNLPREEILNSIGEAFGHLGKPYDFEFNFNVSSRIVCTELVYRCYHRRGDIHFPLVKRLGRFTLTGDDIVNIALDSLKQAGACYPAALQPAGLILKRRDGLPHEVAEDRIIPLLHRIRRGWRPARSFRNQRS